MFHPAVETAGTVERQKAQRIFHMEEKENHPTYLVVEPTPLKNMLVNLDHEFPKDPE